MQSDMMIAAISTLLSDFNQILHQTILTEPPVITSLTKFRKMFPLNPMPHFLHIFKVISDKKVFIISGTLKD